MQGAVNITRIIRELMSNSLKHANPDWIEIRVVPSDDRVQLEYSDNGNSQPVAEWQPGKGLLNIRKRAEEIGAQVELKDRSDGGIHFTLTLEC